MKGKVLISMGLKLIERGRVFEALNYHSQKISGIEIKITENVAVRGHLNPIRNSAFWKSVLREAVL